jgi:hypothetical protein
MRGGQGRRRERAMLKNRVVVRYRDGRRLKGFTWDFLPTKEIFHVADEKDEKKISEISIRDLKAVFFVKTFEGNRERQPGYTLEDFRKVAGLKLKVTFLDGEVLYGTTNAYAPGRKAFFLLPADKTGNNDRVYVFAEATQGIESVQQEAGAPVGVRTSR